MENKKNVKPKVANVTVNKEVEGLKAEVADWKNKYLRALADYQNLEKRVYEEKGELLKMGSLRLIIQLLPFLDHLEKAEIFVKDQGLKMVKESFTNLLKEMGIVELDVLNKEFDPHLSEAIDTVTGEKDNIVVEVLRKGYEYDGKVLRVAQVKVSKKVS